MSYEKEKWDIVRYNIKIINGDDTCVNYLECPVCGKKLPYEPKDIYIYTTKDNKKNNVSGMYCCSKCYRIYAITDFDVIGVNITDQSEMSYEDVLIYELNIKSRFGDDSMADYLANRYYNDYLCWVHFWVKTKIFYKNIVKIFKSSKLSMEEFAIELQKCNPKNYSGNIYPQKQDIANWKRIAKGTLCYTSNTSRDEKIIKNYYPDIDTNKMYEKELDIQQLSDEELFLRQVIQSYKKATSECYVAKACKAYFSCYAEEILKKTMHHISIKVSLNEQICNLNLFLPKNFGIISTKMKFGHIYDDYSFETLNMSLKQMVGEDVDYFYEGFEKVRKKFYYLYFQRREDELFIHGVFEIPNGMIKSSDYTKIVTAYGVALLHINDEIIELSRRSNMNQQQRKKEDDDIDYEEYMCKKVEAEGDSWMYEPEKTYNSYDDIDELENNPDYWDDIYTEAAEKEAKKSHNTEENTSTLASLKEDEFIVNEEIEDSPFSEKFISKKIKYFQDYQRNLYITER